MSHGTNHAARDNDFELQAEAEYFVRVDSSPDLENVPDLRIWCTDISVAKGPSNRVTGFSWPESPYNEGRIYLQ